MEFLKTIGKAVGEAAAYLGEKNHRAAQLSRIRSFLRCQEKEMCIRDRGREMPMRASFSK